MIEQQAVISGLGASDIGRRLLRDPWALTADACLAAIADAGLTVADIDGMSTYPGATGSSPGITGAGTDDVRALLGLKTKWHTGGGEVPGQLGSIINAVLAVAGGLCNHVLCFRTVWESSAQVQLGGRSEVMRNIIARDKNQWTEPYGAAYPTSGALVMQRYMHESGTTREQLGQIAVVARANAALNPQAAYRAPLTLDDYLAAKMISDPLCLLDCDVPVDGSIAFVISRADSDAGKADHAIRFKAVSSAAGFDECGAMLWSRTSLTPADVKVAELYDGFSILAALWLEALRLCPKNGAGRFLEGGHRISRDGELPLNTGGGQLSGGRMHGYGGLYHACLQLRGEADERQIAKRPDVAIVSSGITNFSSALLLGI